jgi:WD40 repeat protein
VARKIDDPYVGLTHFTEDYADLFFGRDTECALIIGNLRAARLTLLYAESGVGKSSLLRAGVMARLHAFADGDLQARGSPRLIPVVFSSWSERPLARLVHAITDAVRPYLPEGARLDLPDDDLERAIEVVGESLDATVLVVLDQFEEYFLYPDERLERKRVASQIAACVNRPDLRANFLISIREDSYARLGDLFRGKVKNVYGNFLHLDFLDRDGARESIEKPIERVNELDPDEEPFGLEPALVDAVLEQVGHEQIEGTEDGKGAGGEPGEAIETTYLQLVMRRLWEEETAADSHRLRLQRLEDLGGSEAIIRGHLDRAMDDEGDGATSLTPDQRRVAAAIFHFLVTSGGTKIALTAKDLADLCELPLAEIEPVLQHLSAPALHILRPVVAEDEQGEPRFEIFHDALARPIVDWRTRVEDEERDARVARERIEKERAQQAAAEAERREARERNRKRLALGLLGLAVAALLVGILAALDRKGELADERKADNQSVRAAEHLEELSSSPTFGPAAVALASVEDYRSLAPTREARDLALEELQLNPGMPRINAGHTRDVTTLAYLPASNSIASGGLDGTVRFWTARGNQFGPTLVNAGGVLSLAVSKPSAGTRIVAAGLGGGRVKVWLVGGAGVLESGALPVANYGAVLGLAFNPRIPTMLAVGGLHRRIALWDLADPGNPRPLGTELVPGGVNNLAFSADGRALLVADSTRGERWRVSASGFAGSGPTTSNPGNAWSVATAPNGSFAFGDENGGITVWDAAHQRGRFLSLPASVHSLAFAGDGSVLVSADDDWSVTTWDVASGRPFGPPRMATRQPMNDVAVSPDQKEIAGAGADGLVRVWPLDPRHALATTLGGLAPSELGRHLPDFWSLAVGSHGLVAAAGGPFGTSIWKLRDPDETDSVTQPLTRIPGRSYAVAYHGDLLAVGRGRSFVLEDTGPTCDTMPAKPCRLAVPEKPHSTRSVSSLAFKEERDHLLIASSGYKEGEGVLNLWDVARGAGTRTIVHLSTRRIHTRGDAEIIQVAFSPKMPLVAAGTSDGKLRVWDTNDPTKPSGIRFPNARGNENQPVSAVAFSPDGKWLASGGGDQQVVFWKIRRRSVDDFRIQATPGTLFQAQTILSLAFSHSGQVLAAGDGTGTTCLYKVKRRNRIGSCLLGHSTESLRTGGITALAFADSPGTGNPLVTAGTAQPIVAWSPILWNLGDGAEQAIARDVCALAKRNLKPYEWNAVFGNTDLADERLKTCAQYPLP